MYQLLLRARIGAMLIAALGGIAVILVALTTANINRAVPITGAATGVLLCCYGIYHGFRRDHIPQILGNAIALLAGISGAAASLVNGAIAFGVLPMLLMLAILMGDRRTFSSVSVILIAATGHILLSSTAPDQQPHAVRSFISLVSAALIGQFFYLMSKHYIEESEHKRCHLEAALASAESANAAKSAFLATMSHEIRTPLNAIVGTSYLMGLSDLSPEHKRDLEIISTSSKNLLALVNDVLDFSKIEAGELELEQRPFSLPEALQDLRIQFSSIAAQKGLHLAFEFNADNVPPVLIGDSNRLKQILINLLNNAIKFTTQGQVGLTVDLCAESNSEEPRLCFKVSDTGIGISEEAQANLFQPFKQADTSTTREYGGTGLGLSIVKRLVELMGGEIRLSSRLGQGSVFEFELSFGISALTELNTPSKNASPNAVESPSVLAPRSKGVEGLNGSTVMVVDDSEINLLVMRRILMSEGMHVVVCDSGESALEVLQNIVANGIPLDAILMDLQMPQMDGCETTLQIRSQSHFDGIPIIALTAGATTTQKERAIAVGMNDFLTKPVEPANLVKVLSSHILG